MTETSAGTPDIREVDPSTNLMNQYVPVIVGVVIAIAATMAVLVTLYFCFWRKGKKGRDAESTLEATYSFHRTISFLGPRLRPQVNLKPALSEDSAVISSVGNSSFPAQLTSDASNPVTAMTSNASNNSITVQEKLEIDASYNLSPIAALASEVFNKSRAISEQPTKPSNISLTIPSEHISETSNKSVIIPEMHVTFDEAKNSKTTEMDVSNSTEMNSVLGVITSPEQSASSMKLKQKLLKRKRAQEEANSSDLQNRFRVEDVESCDAISDENKVNYSSKVIGTNFDGKQVGISQCQEDGSKGGENTKTSNLTSLFNNATNVDSPQDNWDIKNNVETKSHSSRVLFDNPASSLESPDGGCKELDWDSSHEPLKTRTSVLKLVCTPKPNHANAARRETNSSEDTPIKENVDGDKSLNESPEGMGRELDWDSSHEPLRTRSSVLKLVCTPKPTKVLQPKTNSSENSHMDGDTREYLNESLMEMGQELDWDSSL